MTRILFQICADASLDDSNKGSLVYLYDGKHNNMDTVKLDDMTMPFLHYMKMSVVLNTLNSQKQ